MQTCFVYEVIWLKGSRTPPWQCGLPQRGSLRESSAPWVEKCCSSLFCPIQLDVDFEQLDILSNLEKLPKPSRLKGLGLEWWYACPNFICLCTVEKPHCPCTENAYSVSVGVSFPVPGGPLCPLFFYLSKSCVFCLFKKTAGLSETWRLVFYFSHVCFLSFNSFLLPSWGSLLPFQAFWADSLLFLPVLFWVLCFHCRPGLEIESAYFPFWFPSLIQECLALAGRCFFVSIFSLLLISTFSALRAGGQGGHWIWPVHIKLGFFWWSSYMVIFCAWSTGIWKGTKFYIQLLDQACKLSKSFWCLNICTDLICCSPTMSMDFASLCSCASALIL